MNIHNARKKAGSFVFSLFFLLLLIGLIYIFIFPLLTILIATINSPESAADPTVMWVPNENFDDPEAVYTFDFNE